MKRNKFSPKQNNSIRKEFDVVKKAEDRCREHAIGKATFYKWRPRYGIVF